MGVADLFVEAVTNLIPTRPAVTMTPASYSGGIGGIGGPQFYPQLARTYSTNELIYACVETIATSAAEPIFIGHRLRRNSPNGRSVINQERRMQALQGRKNRANNMAGDAWLIVNSFMEETPNHPLIQILNNPNPLVPRGEFYANLARDLLIAGDAFVYKARYAGGMLAGAVAELWRLRPDRVKPVVDDKGQLTGWSYTVNAQTIVIPTSDIMHFKKGQHPTNDHLGWGPVMALMERARIDVYQRNFLAAFYETGGTGPGAVLAVDGEMDQQSKDDIRDRNRRQFGPGNFLEMMVIDNAKGVTYTPLSLNRGLRDALPVDVNSIIETRIATVFNIPGSILGLLVAYANGAYASRKIDWQTLWDINMTPFLSDQDDVFNKNLVSEFGGIDEVCRDLSDIRALAEDVDALHARARANVAAMLWTQEEGRLVTGVPAKPNDGEHFILGTRETLVPTPIEDIQPEQPQPLAPPDPQPAALISRAMVMIAESVSESRRAGRPRLQEDDGARKTWGEARQLREKFPNMTFGQIAERVGVARRTLERYRDAFEEEDD